MATAETWQPAPSLPPPITETGWIGWARANLFGNWLSGIVTVVTVPMILWLVWSIIRWVFGTADWTLIASRPQQYLIGLYPTELAWRPLVGWLLVSILFGMAAAMWGGAARRIAIGYSFVTVLLGVLPYGMFHEGVVMPWWVRALILANVLTIGLGYGLGSHPRTGQPRTFVLGGIAIYVFLLLLLNGLPGFPAMEEVAPRKWGGLMLNLILAVSGIFFAFPIGVLLALGRRSNLPVVKVLCVVFIEVFRGVPLITLALHVASARTARLAVELSRRLRDAGGHCDYALLGGVHGREHSWGTAGAASGSSRGGTCPGSAGLAGHYADTIASGYPQCDTRNRGAVHFAVQGHESGLHCRHAGYLGDGTLHRAGQRPIRRQRTGALHIRGGSVLGLYVHNVICQSSGGTASWRWPTVMRSDFKG